MPVVDRVFWFTVVILSPLVGMLELDLLDHQSSIGASACRLCDTFLHPTKKIDDEKDEEYGSKADIHKALPVD